MNCTVYPLLPGRLPANADDVERHSFGAVGLEVLVGAGQGALGVQTAAAELAAIEANPLFAKLKATVTAKGFFKGTAAGEPEHKERYLKMVARFKEKLKATGAADKAAPAADAGGAEPATAAILPPPPPAAAGATGAAADAAAAPPGEAEAEAEALKDAGNKLLAGKDYEGAVAAYSKAIQASPNGPKSHIYFANRAAARQYLKQYQGALDDCEASIARNPTYSKVRLGALRRLPPCAAGLLVCVPRGASSSLCLCVT